MEKGRPSVLGRNKISVRVLFSEQDYLELDRIAELERTDISTLVRRAVAHHFFIPNKNNLAKPQE
jgi:hypothetical protein